MGFGTTFRWDKSKHLYSIDERAAIEGEFFSHKYRFLETPTEVKDACREIIAAHPPGSEKLQTLVQEHQRKIAQPANSHGFGNGWYK